MPVRVLEDAVINRIAAGEVVERPASVVKELLENALDAGATEIRLELGEGGRALIRLSDNGSGMDRQDAILCIERHATSKITSDADLQHIATLGFRGEALPSIASVSRFDLRTRGQQAAEGTRVLVEGGRLSSVEPCGCPPGTEIQVRDLFFNVKPRRAFLKAARTEYIHCMDTFVRVALVRPDVDFTLLHDGREVQRAPRCQGLAERAADLLGTTGAALRPCAFEREGITVKGLISPVGVHKESQGASTWLYVNGRFVRDAAARKAITTAYQGLVPIGRSPVVLLDLRIDPERVDVNVHPAKTEVRFREAWVVENVLGLGIREALRDFGLHAPLARPARPEPPAPESTFKQVDLPLKASPGPMFAREERASFPVEAARAPTSPVAPSPAAPRVAPREPEPQRPAPPLSPPPSPAIPASRLLPVPSFADLHVIGQYAATYILCEGAGELCLIDQHAAHERVMLERLQRQVSEQGIPSQLQLVPILIELSASRAAALEERCAELERLGIDIGSLGGGTFSLRGTPASLNLQDPRALILDIADELVEGERARPKALQDIEQRVLSRLACHSAIRAHQILSLYEMRGLLVELDQVDYGVCAHGRPVLVRIGIREIEARFHRV